MRTTYTHTLSKREMPKHRERRKKGSFIVTRAMFCGTFQCAVPVTEVPVQAEKRHNEILDKLSSMRDEMGDVAAKISLGNAYKTLFTAMEPEAAALPRMIPQLDEADATVKVDTEQAGSVTTSRDAESKSMPLKWMTSSCQVQQCLGWMTCSYQIMDIATVGQ
jgi:hypothetical protein